jgi:NADH:ubiquinone oxidoreductase subunit 5 (subunit L)/multisubunit Na+/H+ antiporter MnhA subunit
MKWYNSKLEKFILTGWLILNLAVVLLISGIFFQMFVDYLIDNAFIGVEERQFVEDYNVREFAKILGYVYILLLLFSLLFGFLGIGLLNLIILGFYAVKLYKEEKKKMDNLDDVFIEELYDYFEEHKKEGLKLVVELKKSFPGKTEDQLFLACKKLTREGLLVRKRETASKFRIKKFNEFKWKWDKKKKKISAKLTTNYGEDE